MTPLLLTLSFCVFAAPAIAESSRRVEITPPAEGDATAMVLAALMQCKETGASELFFAPGTYHFTAGANPANPRANITADDLDNLTIDGQGATFLFDGLTSPFVFSKCRNLTLRNVVIDWKRPPFSIGEVVASKVGEFDVAVFPEYPIDGPLPVGAYMDFEPDTRLPVRHGMDVYNCVESTEVIAPQVLRVHTVHGGLMKLGSWAALRHQVYGYNAVAMVGCDNTLIEDVTVYTVPGMAFIGMECNNTTLRGCKVLLKPGTRHLVSATADGSHWSGCTGMLRIEDCVFEGMGDDAVNMKSGLYLEVREKVDARTVLAAHNLKIPAPPKPGHSMEMTPAATLLPYANAVVESAALEPDGFTSRVVFRDSLPEQLAVGDLLGDATPDVQAIVRGCTIRNNRARGMLIQTRNVIVEECLFENVTSGGVWVLTEVTHFYESIPSRNVIVRNNRFINCNYGGPLGWGVLCVYAIMKDYKDPPQPGIFRNIVLENNIIQDADNSAIFVSGAENLVVRGNTITGSCRMPTREDCTSAINLITSRNVLIEGNTVQPDQQGEAYEGALRVGPGCDESTITKSGNTRF